MSKRKADKPLKSPSVYSDFIGDLRETVRLKDERIAQLEADCLRVLESLNEAVTIAQQREQRDFHRIESLEAQVRELKLRLATYEYEAAQR